VERNGGKIKVESEPGMGSNLYLPCCWNLLKIVATSSLKNFLSLVEYLDDAHIQEIQPIVFFFRAILPVIVFGIACAENFHSSQTITIFI